MGKRKTTSDGGNNVGWKELRIDLAKDKEVRVDLTRNAPDKRGRATTENYLRDPKEKFEREEE